MTDLAAAPARVVAAVRGERRRHRRRAVAWAGLLTAVLGLSIAVAVSVGPVRVPVGTVWQLLGHHLLGTPEHPDWTPAQDTIGWLVRTPRVLLAVLVGALLAVCGATVQALVRNVLAEPYLLGVSSGASVGAAASLLLGAGAGLGAGVGTGLGLGGATTLSVAAFAGGLAATAATVLTARIAGRLTPVRLMLAGISVSYALSAVTSAMIFASDSRDAARGVLFWLLGALDQARWGLLPVPALALAACLLLLMRWARRLDAIAVGDETALTLGVHPDRFRAQAFVVVALGTGAAVAAAGPIGFVGLVVPHVARLVAGGGHRVVLPLSALLGAITLVWADIAARLLLAPRELPLGVVTALVGAPFLVLLVRRFRGIGA